MPPQFNEYYQCSSSGYIKHSNVPANHLPIIREIPVASKCNEILPYILHKIQVKQPLTHSSAKELARQSTVPTLLIPSTEVKKQNSLNYSFSTSLMQDTRKILQKDEVHSIHLDQKSNSTRIKTVQNSVDLTKSAYTSSRKHSPDMKRSLYSTNHSVLTHLTISKQKQNEKLDMFAGELQKEREKREQFEKKYEILFNIVNRAQQVQETVTLKEPSQNSEKFHNNPQGKSKEKNNKIQKKKYYMRSSTESQEESEQERPVQMASKKGRRKGSSPSPIVINIGPQMLKKIPNSRKQKTVTPSQNEQQHLTEIKQGLHEIKRQVQILHENVEYLQKKLDDQQIRHQKEILMQELKQKERKIEEVVKENQKIKEINDLLINKRVEAVNNQHTEVFGINLERNSMSASFVISLLVILLVLNLKNAIC